MSEIRKYGIKKLVARWRDVRRIGILLPLVLSGVLLFIFISGAFISCSGGGIFSEASREVQAAPAEAAFRDFAADSAPLTAAGERLPEEHAPDLGTGEQEVVERKLVSSGSMELMAEDLGETEEAIRKTAAAYGGYIASASRTQDRLVMTVKIPAGRFDPFLEEASGFGTLRSKSINVEDVTDRYFDLEHRIRGKEILVERYQNYLTEARSIEDILTVERELNSAITELEQLKGSFRSLSHLVAFSTLRMTVRLPSYASDTGPLPSIRAGLRAFGRTAAYVLYALFFIVLGIIVFVIPCVLVFGLFYWIGFGRIGVVRRFFRKLRTSERKAG